MEISVPSPAVGTLLLALAALAALNAKGLPLVHTAQLLPSVYRLFRPRLFPSRRTGESAPGAAPSGSQADSALSARTALFAPLVTHSRATITDLDVNMHKSNSTFFSDADAPRAALLTGLLSESLAGLGPANFILAGVQCRFGREIAPFKAYAISTRILAWDDRSLFLLTYFLKPGARLPDEVDLLGGGPAGVLADEKYRKLVFATMVCRYVFKAGRKTVTPREVLEKAGLLLREGKVTEKGGSKKVYGPEELAKILETGRQYASKGLDL